MAIALISVTVMQLLQSYYKNTPSLLQLLCEQDPVRLVPQNLGRAKVSTSVFHS